MNMIGKTILFNSSVHSQLLEESLLVSFPTLSNMLKLSSSPAQSEVARCKWGEQRVSINIAPWLGRRGPKTYLTCLLKFRISVAYRHPLSSQCSPNFVSTWIQHIYQDNLYPGQPTNTLYPTQQTKPSNFRISFLSYFGRSFFSVGIACLFF